MKEQHIKINFSATGYVDQDILITDENYTPEQVIEGLKNETIITTMQEGGDVVDTATVGWYVIGTVVANESSLEHRHFQSDGDYELAIELPKPFDASRLALSIAVGDVLSDIDELTCEEAMRILHANDEMPSHKEITVAEEFELLSGDQLHTEIKEIQKGYMSMMELAFKAGKDGKEMI